MYIITYIDPKTYKTETKTIDQLNHAINFVTYLMISKTEFVVQAEETKC